MLFNTVYSSQSRGHICSSWEFGKCVHTHIWGGEGNKKFELNVKLNSGRKSLCYISKYMTSYKHAEVHIMYYVQLYKQVSFWKSFVKYLAIMRRIFRIFHIRRNYLGSFKKVCPLHKVFKNMHWNTIFLLNCHTV